MEEVCTWDWGAITNLMAAGIAAGVAFWISNQWGNQKGKEFVANEAKLLIEAVNDLLPEGKELYELLEGVRPLQGENNDITRKIDKLSFGAKKLWKNMQFFEDCLAQDKIISELPLSDRVLRIIRLCNEYSSAYSNRENLIANAVYSNSEYESKSYWSELETINTELDFSLHELKKYLLPFAAYKFQQRKNWWIF
jgi:hypothetical protein